MADNTIRTITSVTDNGGVNHTDVNGYHTRTGGGTITAFDTVLVAVGGCSCAVLEGLLKRDGYSPVKITGAVEGTRGEVPPRPFVAVKVHFGIECPGLDAQKAAKYVESVEQHCPVIQSLKCSVTSTFELK
ncbi:MAG: OsmC family protein [Chloroflexota bacterium]